MSADRPISDAERAALKKAFVGDADRADFVPDAEQWRGPIVVGDKTFLLKVGIAFTGLGLLTSAWLLYHQGFFTPLVILIGMMGMGVVVFVQRLLTAAYVLRIDERGLDDRTQDFGGGLSRWEELAGCRVVSADSRPMIGLELTEAARAGRDVFSKALIEEQRRDLGVDIVLPPEVFGVDDPKLYADFLQRYIDEPALRARLAEAA